MSNPVKEAADAWTADAIEKCRNDPAVEAAGLCYVCMCSHPCLCDRKAAISEMRRYYEANRRIEPGKWERFLGAQPREEPKLIGSWGVDMDGLMTGLYDIAMKHGVK